MNNPINSSNSTINDVIEKLVLANKILVQKDILDAFGHVSVRHPFENNCFLLSRSLAPSSVTKDDIVQYDLSSNAMTHSGSIGYAERFIHGEIYRARPDVTAVVHSHSMAIITFGLSGVALEPMFHMGACVAGHSVFDLNDFVGDSDLLIKTETNGRYLADRLGRANLVLMRGHGSTMVAPSLEEAVFRAVYAETNAKIQINALSLGKPKPLSVGEAELSLSSQSVHHLRAWDVWCSEIGDDRTPRK